MSRSRETFGKKEVRDRKNKKRKEKEQRKQEKKASGKQSLDDMIGYVDENGIISSTPPDTTQKKEEIDVSTIEIGTPKKEFREVKLRKGVVTMFNEEKRFGFIADKSSRDSVFFHINDCKGEIKKGDIVEFDTEMGNGGLKAVGVKHKNS